MKTLGALRSRRALGAGAALRAGRAGIALATLRALEPLRTGGALCAATLKALRSLWTLGPRGTLRALSSAARADLTLETLRALGARDRLTLKALRPLETLRARCSLSTLRAAARTLRAGCSLRALIASALEALRSLRAGCALRSLRSGCALESTTLRALRALDACCALIALLTLRAAARRDHPSTGAGDGRDHMRTWRLNAVFVQLVVLVLCCDVAEAAVVEGLGVDVLERAPFAKQCRSATEDSIKDARLGCHCACPSRSTAMGPCPSSFRAELFQSDRLGAKS